MILPLALSGISVSLFSMSVVSISTTVFSSQTRDRSYISTDRSLSVDTLCRE